MINKLSEQARELINTHEIFISPVVRLELQYLFEIQRITDEAQRIVSDLAEHIGLKVCEKNFNAIIRSALRHSWTRDPFDRLIVGNADLNQNILVTKDVTILAHYEKALW
jgi:PIN domain nuclease of toxin-antitoxin system